MPKRMLVRDCSRQKHSLDRFLTHFQYITHAMVFMMAVPLPQQSVALQYVILKQTK
jgi:hypothetical protein